MVDLCKLKLWRNQITYEWNLSVRCLDQTLKQIHRYPLLLKRYRWDVWVIFLDWSCKSFNIECLILHLSVFLKQIVYLFDLILNFIQLKFVISYSKLVIVSYSRLRLQLNYAVILSILIVPPCLSEFRLN